MEPPVHGTEGSGRGGLSLSEQTSSLVHTKKDVGASAIRTAVVVGLTTAAANTTTMVALQNSIQTVTA